MKLLSSGLAALFLALAPLTATPSLAAPLSAYGRLPLIEDAQISPDGTMIAYAMTNGDARLVLVKAIADGKVVASLNASDKKVREIQWATSGYLLISITTTTLVPGLVGPKREYLQVVAYDLATKKSRLLMEKAPDAMNVVIGPPMVRMLKGEPHVIVEGIHWAGGDRGRNSLFDIKLSNGFTRVHEQGQPNTTDWVVANDGTAIAQTEYDSVTGQWGLRFQKNNRWELVDSRLEPLGGPALAGFGQDGVSVLLMDYDEETEVRVTREYRTDGSSPGDVTLPPYDGLLRNPVTHALMGTWELKGDTLNYSFFDKKDQAVWRGISKAFPGQPVHLVSWSDDRRRIVVRVEDPQGGPFYALVDLDKGSADLLSSIYSGLKPQDIAEVRPVKYKAADGLEITGYLTLPRGRTAEKLPLVVMPHGGPAARDEPGFDWWAQGLASRGYAVLQPNFRGSDGFGREFLEAGYGEWGRKMQSDLSDGVRYLAAQGTIDPKDDTVVLYAQSQRMYDALRKAGRPVELVTLKAEDHWLSRSDTRLQTLEATVAFVEKHNPAN